MGPRWLHRVRRNADAGITNAHQENERRRKGSCAFGTVFSFCWSVCHRPLADGNLSSLSAARKRSSWKSDRGKSHRRCRFLWSLTLGSLLPVASPLVLETSRALDRRHALQELNESPLASQRRMRTRSSALGRRRPGGGSHTQRPADRVHNGPPPTSWDPSGCLKRES
jgi:hypothetical protein